MDQNNNPNSDSRKVTVSCRVLPEQKLLIAEKAKSMGMSTSQYLEAKVLREDTFSLEDKIEKQGHELQSLKSQLRKAYQDLQKAETLEQNFMELQEYKDGHVKTLENIDVILEENERLRNEIDELRQNENSNQKENSNQNEELKEFDFPKFKWWMILIPIGLILLIYFVFGSTRQQNTVAVVQPANPNGFFLQ